MEDNNEDVARTVGPCMSIETPPPPSKLCVSPLRDDPTALESDPLDGHEDQAVSFREFCEEPALDATENKGEATTSDVMVGQETVSGDEAGGDSDSDSCGDDEDDEEEEEEEVEVDEHDVKTESVTGSVDNEVERHEVNSALLGTDMSVAAMAEASQTALFRRYSKMTPTAMEEQERSFHEDAFQDSVAIPTHPAFCPEPTAHACQNPACAEQLQWRDARIAELQAALDHMTEAMAIQQRDMASQRVFLSRQAEQLTNLSNKLHQDKVALHVERERFQQTVASTPQLVSIANKLKPAAGKIKSPVKKLFAGAAARRASFNAGVESTGSVSRKLHSSSTTSLAPASRTLSSTQLRRNPLVSDCSTLDTPMRDRSSSLSTLDLRLSSDQSVIAMTPPKLGMVEVNLNDGFSPVKRPNPTADTPSAPLPPLDRSTRVDRVDSSSDLSADQKKQSLGDRLRSIRWGRS